jgi:hypothetical protein
VWIKEGGGSELTHEKHGQDEANCAQVHWRSRTKEGARREGGAKECSDCRRWRTARRSKKALPFQTRCVDAVVAARQLLWQLTLVYSLCWVQALSPSERSGTQAAADADAAAR